MVVFNHSQEETLVEIPRSKQFKKLNSQYINQRSNIPDQFEYILNSQQLTVTSMMCLRSAIITKSGYRLTITTLMGIKAVSIIDEDLTKLSDGSTNQKPLRMMDTRRLWSSDISVSHTTHMQ